MHSLIDYYSSRQKLILNTIQKLVEHETPSHNEQALNVAAHFVANLLSETDASVDLIPEPGFGTHLIAKFKGAENAPHILLIGHLDTVWPTGTLDRLPFRITKDGRAHGPGIFDMKSGIVAAIESLLAIKSLNLPFRRSVTLLITCDEEIGSRKSRALIENEARNAAAALILEPPVKGGIVKTGRKGIGTFNVKAIGKAAHAGLDPTKGINAIVELSHQILRLAAINDFDRGITVSPGIINGGTALNVVPAEATVKVDARFSSLQDGKEIEAAILNLAPVLGGAMLEITGGINRPPMERSDKNLSLFRQARDLANELGFDLSETVVGGGSDGNFTSAMGIPTLDGLGIDGDGAHADHEHIVIDDIPRRIALLTKMILSI